MTTALLDTVEPVTDPNMYVFTLNDRCDADKGSPRSDGKGVSVAEQAFHRATKNGMELFFCEHHYHTHETALLTDGWKVESDHAAIESMTIRHKVYSEVDGE